MTIQEPVLYIDDDREFDEFPIREGLTYKQRKEAEFLRTISKGVMLITGKAGSGKDLLGHSIAYMNKYYFGRRVLLDSPPKKAFGEYTLFNTSVMMKEIDKMAKSSRAELTDNEMQDINLEWIEQNQTMFRGAVLYLQELKRYCYNRNPHNPVNKFIGSLCTVWRHLDLLIIGTHIQKHEIDQYSFLYYVSHWAKCTWNLTRPNTTDAKITRGAFIGSTGVFDVTAKPIILHVDGNKERDILNGKRFYDLYHSKNDVNLKPTIRRDL